MIPAAGQLLVCVDFKAPQDPRCVWGKRAAPPEAPGHKHGGVPGGSAPAARSVTAGQVLIVRRETDRSLGVVNKPTWSEDHNEDRDNIRWRHS